jgi:hypothetical protein
MVAVPYMMEQGEWGGIYMKLIISQILQKIC